ncbi:hypothetical protein DRH29_05310 [candidate division Kazan bacterium]|uniref:Head decoration protein n=1 Tax=candidate division Kazan bacterium TaxID=2202143 RepID=A0A420ZB79_UNCK3|nr:MAG: hypothetical protein DRH29_05310 [candidate division Kazan bacterium]
MAYTSYTYTLPTFVHTDQPFVVVHVVAGASVSKGTVAGEVTATGKYKAYNNSASDGTETAKGIFLADASTDEVVPLLVFGVVKESEVTGVDSAAKTDLAGKIWFLDANNRWAD